MVNKYGFDWFNENVIVPAVQRLGGGLWRFGDQIVIDEGLVNGSARTVGWLGSVMRYAQSGYLYHYAFAMILGLASLLLCLFSGSPDLARLHNDILDISMIALPCEASSIFRTDFAPLRWTGSMR